MTGDPRTWLEAPPEDCRPADLAFLALDDTFVSGDPSDHRLSVRYYQRNGEQVLLGKVIFGPGTQGPPDHAHGGAQAALLDEAMGGAAWLAGHPVVAANLDITFRQMLPLGTPCLVETRVTGVDGRKVRTSGVIRSRDGQRIFSEGTALFVVLDETRIDHLSDKARVILERMRRHRNGGQAD